MSPDNSSPESSPSFVSFGRSSRHTACSNFDRGTSGQRSWRDRVRPVSVISTREPGRSFGEPGLLEVIPDNSPFVRDGADSRRGVLLSFAGASSRRLPPARRFTPGLAARLYTSGLPRRAVRSVLPGEFSKLSISIGSEDISSTSTGAEVVFRTCSGYPSNGILEAGINPK